MTREQEPSFAQLLRHFRQAAGLSQEALAERAGLTAAAIGALERGERRHPYPHTLQALADALGLSDAERRTFFMSVPRRGTRSEVPAAGGSWSSPPAPLTSLIGREREIAIVTGLFPNERARMVTLTGPGGVGKTRVAIETAGLLRDQFPAGIAWVELAPVRDPSVVPSAIAHALGLSDRTGEDVAESLERYLAQRQALLVLDNFEHLLAAVPLVSALLKRCPQLAVLATSRAALRVSGEHEVQLQPLALPDPDSYGDPASVVDSAAVQLLVLRTRAVRPQFDVTVANARSIAGICVQLDGIPLALELAAAQLRYTSPAALLDMLSDRMAPLHGSPRDLPDRQRSLRATVEWSHNLLTPLEQDLFRRLAVFAGGFTAEAASIVCSPDERSRADVARMLLVLVDNSLIQAIPDASGQDRFAMLETIRAYARERLVQAGEERLIANRHASYFCELAESAEMHVADPLRGIWLQLLDRDRDNLRTALDWSASRGDLCVGLRVVGALGWFWILLGYVREGSEWTDIFLSSPCEACGVAVRAGTLYTAAALAWKREDLPRARGYAEEAVALHRALGDGRRLALSLAVAGHIAISEGKFDRAIRVQNESLSLFREQGSAWGIAYALGNLGDGYLMRKDLETARRLFSESIELFSEIDDQWGRAIVLNTLGAVAWAQGDAATARARYGESVDLCRCIGDPENIARGLLGLAAAALAQGDSDTAERALMESISNWHDIGNVRGISLCIAGLAGVQASRGRYLEAARLFGASEAMAEDRSLVYLIDPGMFSSYLRETRKHLSEAEFTAAWAEGKAATPDEKVAALSKAEGE